MADLEPVLTPLDLEALRQLIRTPGPLSSGLANLLAASGAIKQPIGRRWRPQAAGRIGGRLGNRLQKLGFAHYRYTSAGTGDGWYATEAGRRFLCKLRSTSATPNSQEAR